MEQLNVIFGLEIVYVYGTVNGVEADWSLTAPDVWSAIVPKADDGIYEINITAYNSLGTFTEYSTTICKLQGLIDPKIDWGPDDYFNFQDMNRIEANASYVKDLIERLTGPFSIGKVIVDREMDSFDFDSDLNRIEGNIAILADKFVEPLGWQDPKTDWQGGVSRFGHHDANRLEKNLKLLHDLLVLTLEHLPYCGEYYCGEEVI